MRHEEMIKTDPEYKRTYDLMLEHNMNFEKIIECVVKSNRIVGVGIVSLKQGVDTQLDDYMRGY